MPIEPNRLRDVFLSAAEVPEPERAAYLDRACGFDAELRVAVERLLAAHADPASHLEPPAALLPPTDFHTPQPDTGTILAGRYKLLEEIGEGGMGTVWVAQQTEPIKRTVAAKLIKPGMDSQTVLARFDAERQALALMDHPNIAKVLDAGATSDGRPFFVMELVKGVPITQFCDARRLNPRQRLELFVPVCQAIQHAHQKGIIHRDIKPSNVLMALYDDRPVAKVIDFGVAKATAQALTEQTLHTDFGTVIGTPQYMSPEQATFNNLDVDTRSDVYSLGVLLYELLVGSPPFAKREMERAGMLEMLRLVREVEPPRPSTKLSTAETLPTLAANRSTEPKKLTGMLRNELDWIVMKALEKDRTRRYETANGFAADVLRYLSGEPVQAVPPSVSYRLRKFVRKHKGPMLAASVVVLALFGALAATVYGAIEAADRRTANLRQEQAERERDTETRNKVEQARQGVDAGLKLATELRKQYRFKPAEASLVQAEELARKGLPDRLLEVEQARHDLAFAVTLDDIRYRKWIWIVAEGVKGHFNTSIAPREYRQAFAGYGLDLTTFAPTEAAKRIEESPIRADLVAAVDDWATYEQDNFLKNRLLEVARRADPGTWTDRLRDPAVRTNPKALEKLAADADPTRTPPAALVVLASLMIHRDLNSVPMLSAARVKYPTNFELAFALGQWHMKNSTKDREKGQQIGPYEAARALRPEVYAVWINLGSALEDVGEGDRAIEVFKGAIAVEPKLTFAYYRLGTALLDKRDLDGAIAAYKQALVIEPEFAWVHCNMGKALLEKGDWAGAIAASKHALAIDPTLAPAYSNLGLVLHHNGDLAGAIAAFHTAIRLDPESAKSHNNLGLALQEKGDRQGALRALKVSLRLDGKFAPSRSNMGRLLYELGNVDGAILEYKLAIGLDPANAPSHINLGTALQAKGDVNAAIAEYKLAIELDSDSAPAHYNLGTALRAKGELDAAIAAYKQAIAINPKHAKAHYSLGNALKLKGDVDGAITKYEQAIELDSKLAPAHYSLGLAFSARKGKGDLDGAIAAYKRAIELDAKYALAHFNLGLALEEKEDWNGALAAFKEVIAREPTNADAYANLGNVLKSKGDLDGAIKAYKQAIAIEPKLALAYYGLGNALNAKGELDDAIAAFKQAIAIEPKDALTHFNLGIVLHKKRDLDGAITAFKDAIVSDPKYALAHYSLGVALGEKGDVDGAIAAYKRTIELDSRYVPAHNNLGIALSAKKDYDGALKAYEQAIALDPKSATLHNNRGSALRAKGDLDGAIKAYKQAGAIEPKFAPAYTNLGSALRAKGDLDGAVAAFKQVIAIQPKSATAHTDLGSVYLQQKKYQAAIACARAAIEVNPKFSTAHAMLGHLLRLTGDVPGARAALTEAVRLDKRWAPLLAQLPPVAVAPPPHEAMRPEVNEP